MLDAEMETKLGYSKHEKSDNENSRNGYYKETSIQPMEAYQ